MLSRKDEVVRQNTRGVEFLFRKNKITWAKGRGVLRAGNVVEVEAVGGAGAPPAEKIATYQAKSVIIATGSEPIELPFLKFDETRILSNIGALIIPKVPEHLVVVGGGVIGLELGSVWNRLGAKVTITSLLAVRAIAASAARRISGRPAQTPRTPRNTIRSCRCRSGAPLGAGGCRRPGRRPG